MSDYLTSRAEKQILEQLDSVGQMSLQFSSYFIIVLSI